MHPIITALLPELTLVIGASLILLIGLVGSSNGRNSRPAVAPSAVLLLAMLTVVGALHLSWRLAGGDDSPTPALLQDSLVWYVRLATLAVGLLLLLVNHHVPEAGERTENAAMILFSLAGVLLVADANDLVSLFLALELVSIPTYILIGLSRRSLHTQEATVKYFFLGSFAAALTLYGFSFLYGAAGTMRLFGGAEGGSIHFALTRPDVTADPLVIVGLALAVGGLLFKLAAVPLHFYVADVYQGAASPVAGLLGFVPKFTGFIALIRLFSLAGWACGDAIFWLLWLLAAATMFVGNTLALLQHNVKRILAYSSIAHAGYMLVALLVGPRAGGDPSPLEDGLSALLFYVPMYGVMNLGAFAALAFFRKTGPDGDDGAESLEDIAGAARRHPWACLALAICTLGLMGFPLTGGFLAKLYVLSSALAAPPSATHTAMVVLVVLAVVNSAIGAAYYIRILAACYIRPAGEAVTASRCPALRLALGLCAVVVLLVFFRPGSLIAQTKAAVRDVVGGNRMAIMTSSLEAAWTSRPGGDQTRSEARSPADGRPD
jgi:NADH-quinone oxidoreductase subunit N